MVTTNTFGSMVFSFFRNHLINQKGCSLNTVASYSDCIRLLIKYNQKTSATPIEKMAIENLTEKVVLDFLDDLEANRGASPTTRNQRLAAIKTFFRFLANEEPTLVAAYEKICAIPAKNTTRKIIDRMDQAVMPSSA